VVETYCGPSDSICEKCWTFMDEPAHGAKVACKRATELLRRFLVRRISPTNALLAMLCHVTILSMQFSMLMIRAFQNGIYQQNVPLQTHKKSPRTQQHPASAFTAAIRKATRMRQAQTGKTAHIHRQHKSRNSTATNAHLWAHACRPGTPSHWTLQAFPDMLCT
jgi:hypothetical protein